MTEIDFATPEDAADQEFVTEATALVNAVYAEGEKGIWVDETTRTDAAEIETIIRAGQLVVARRQGVLLGVVRAQRLPTGEVEFGMLAAHPDHRGTGLGSQLVAFVEQWAGRQGASIVQLELLNPSKWQHPVKAFLQEWYTRSGYRLVHRADFAKSYPVLAPRLATPCDYLVFHKLL